MQSGNNQFIDEMFNLSADKDLDLEVDKLFHFYRSIGYPNYELGNYSLEKEYNKLVNFDTDQIVIDKTIKQNLTGAGILWTYFPHWIEVKCGKEKKSLKELWEDDEQLKKLIRKTYIWKLKHNEPHWTHNRIRQNAKVFLSGQSVSNFRPTVAKYIYDKYGSFGRVLDMSAGFGGRMFGFSASSCYEYVGFDPSSKTYEGLVELKNDLIPLCNKKIEVYKKESQWYYPEYYNYFDLCFTSPPYFDTEKYSEEETQSYKRYPTLNDWLEQFLKPMIYCCYDYLVKYGKLVINIANTSQYNNLEENTINYALGVGFNLKEILKMEMSSISGKQRKIEPIFVFEKK